MNFDSNIYSGPQRELGVYGTRRHPKGSGGAGVSVPGGGTPLDARPAPISLTHSGLGPIAQAARWTYQVPPKRRAKLESALTYVTRAAAAAPAQGASAIVTLQRSGTSVEVPISHAQIFDNTLGARHDGLHTGPLELFEGDILRGYTVDLSTGGATLLRVDAVLTEMDAVLNVGTAFVQSSTGGTFTAAGTKAATSGGSSGVPTLFGSGVDSVKNRVSPF